MWTKDSIEIVGYNKRNIKNRFFVHEVKTDYLTIIVAGFGYTMDAPYIYYSKYIPYQLNSDVLLIDLDYGQLNKFIELPDEKKDEWFEADFIGIKNSINKLSHYLNFWLIGKSLGTTVLLKLFKEKMIREKTRKIVWLTPGLSAEEIYSTIAAYPVPSFVVCGDKDSYTKIEQINKLKAVGNVKILSVMGGDHSLETDDILESIEYLKTYLKELKNFCEY